MEKLFPTVSLFGKVNYAVTDYKLATNVIIDSARKKKSFGVSALAVHGLIESCNRTSFCDAINNLDLVVPDGQPVRWALNSFHKVRLKDRVAGPILVRYIFEEANKHHLKIFLYGSKLETLTSLTSFVNKQYPNIVICGVHPDRFREASFEEDIEDIEKIERSGAHIVLVGRGCPRQELWVSSHIGKINSVMMAVGAAFDFHAGNISHAPQWMQDIGLEWFYRLIQDPKRLWKRYLFTNTQFILLFCKYKIKATLSPF